MTSGEDITLAQGLEEFYSRYTDQLSHTDEDIPQEVREFFRSHDVAHVVFGCDISLIGEGSVKMWTISGTTLGFWNHIAEYRKANAFELSRKLNTSNWIQDFIQFIFKIPVLFMRANQMVKPWPWTDFEKYLDVPISDIRKEFNIRPV